SGPLAYSAPPGTHVILDPPGVTSGVSAKRDGAGCAINVRRGGVLPAHPLVMRVDETCKVALDLQAPAASAVGTHPPRTRTHSPRSGCCGAQTTPGSAFATSAIVLAMLLRSRRRASAPNQK